MLPPNNKLSKVPPLAKNIPILDKDVTIKQAHQSFVVLGNSENESNYLKTEDSEKNMSKNKPVNVPFQNIDLSRLRSPNIPYVGKTANRDKKSDVQYADFDISKPNNNSRRFSDEHEYIDASDEEQYNYLCSSYPLERKAFKKQLLVEGESPNNKTKGYLDNTDVKNERKNVRILTMRERSVSGNEQIQKRNVAQSLEKHERNKHIKVQKLKGSLDKRRYNSPMKQKGMNRAEDIPYNRNDICNSINKAEAFEEDLSESSPHKLYGSLYTDETESNLTSPIKNSTKTITSKGMHTKEKDKTEKYPKRIISSNAKHHSDESSSEEEITIRERKSKSVKGTKNKTSEGYKKWPLRPSWVLNQTQVTTISFKEQVQNSEIFYD